MASASTRIATVTLIYAHAQQRLAALREQTDILSGRSRALAFSIRELADQQSQIESAFAAHLDQLHQARVITEAATMPPGYDPALFGDLRPGQTRIIEDRQLVDEARVAEIRHDPELLRVRRMIEAKRNALAKLERHWHPLAELLRRCDNWTVENRSPPGLAVEIDPRLASAGLDELRAMLPKLATEHEAIERAPLTQAEARQRLKSAIDTAAASVPMPSIAPFVSPNFARPTLSGPACSMPRDLVAEFWEMASVLAPEGTFTAISKPLDEYYASLPRGAALSSADRTR